MARNWYTSSAILASINDDGTSLYQFDGIPGGSTLLRTIVHVWAFGYAGFPDESFVSPPCPVAFSLTETNSTVNPGPPPETPWGEVGFGHELAQAMLTMNYAPMSRTVNVPGNSTPGLLGAVNYIFNPEPTDFIGCWGNSTVDSHAQRFFPSNPPMFAFQCKAGPLASFIADVDYVCVATMRHLFSTPG